MSIRGKKTDLNQISNIMLKSSNVYVITPFEDSHKEAIIKSLETTKLDIQITTENNSIILTIGEIPDTLKKECLSKTKKLFEAFKEDIKNLRHSSSLEIKKLEKIMGSDESKRIVKYLNELFEKYKILI